MAHGQGGAEIGFDRGPTLTCNHEAPIAAYAIQAGALAAEPAVAHSVRLANTSSNGWGVQEEVTHTLDCTAGPAIHRAMQVRRLTPRECERLQGFPDDYTLIPWRKKPAEDCPDGPRYKALGNSWAVPNVRWIGRRIWDEVYFPRDAQ